MLLVFSEDMFCLIPDTWIMEFDLTVVPVLGAPVVDAFNASLLGESGSRFEDGCVKRLVLLGKWSLLDGLSIRRPRLGLKLVNN